MTQRDLLKILLVMALLILWVLNCRCGGLSDKDIRVIEAGDKAMNDTLEIKEPK